MLSPEFQVAFGEIEKVYAVVVESTIDMWVIRYSASKTYFYSHCIEAETEKIFMQIDFRAN